MRLADIVDEYGDVEVGNKVFQAVKVRGCRFGVVEREDLGVDAVFGVDFGGECFELRSCAGNEEDIVFAGGKLEGEFFADTI